MKKEFITDDLSGDLEVLFPERDLFYGQDGNLYSEESQDYTPLAYVTPAEKDEDGCVLSWKCCVNI